MDHIYWIILIALLLLSVFDLINGVSNDAVNFLTSAIGSKAAPVRVILTVASVGVLLGAVFSGGMMEVARNGIFNPQMFTFHEVMLLFLAVMLGEVILLDTFNTFGLPTSTTVSLVFGILGSATATAFYKDSQNVMEYLNTDQAMGIVSGILISVVIAFTIGTLVMWFSRLIFSFRYQRPFRWYGFAWCGFAMTAICYFAIYKGLRGSALEQSLGLTGLMEWIDAHFALALLTGYAGFSLLMAICQHLLMTNILRIAVLAGTFALALAFAGNDLVNFIGVFMGAHDAFAVVSTLGGDVSSHMMVELSKAAPPIAPQRGYLLAAGLIMIGALWFSRKAKTVIATGVELSRQGDGGIERFGSIPPARVMVRGAIALGDIVKHAIPARMRVRMNRRWDPAPLPQNPKDRPSFDLIRATVNLTVASLLISFATSMQLPLSTTYVTFMVAMGSSLADKAWGRESAVYRVTGVLTVVSGWFMTGLAAFIMAALMATALHFGQQWAIFPLLGLVVFILVRSTVYHKKREARIARHSQAQEVTEDNIVAVCSQLVSESVQELRGIFIATLPALRASDRKELKELAEQAESLSARNNEAHKYDVLPILYKMQRQSLDSGYHYVQALDHLNEASTSLKQFTESIFAYVDNNHTPFTVEQNEDLNEVCSQMTKYMDEIASMLTTGNFSPYAETLSCQDNLMNLIAKATKRQIKRAQRNQSRTRSSILYLGMLNEMRFMTVQLRALVSDQKDFLTM